MIYDPENKEVYFSTEMIQSDADAAVSYEHFKAYQQECIKNPGVMLKNQMRDANGLPSTSKTVFGVAASIAVLVGIVAAILCIPMKKYEYIPWLIGAVMIFLGITPFVPSDPRKAGGFAESLLFRRIGGVISLLGAAGLILVHFLYPKDNMLLYLLALACEIAIVVFLAMLVKIIGYATAPRTVYSEEVSAACVGYVRTYTSNGGDDSIFLPVHSPVFEYHYDGVKYQAYYDLFQNGKDGKIPVGAETKIRIDPDSPGRVYGGNKEIMSGPLCFSILSFVASVVLLIILFSMTGCEKPVAVSAETTAESTLDMEQAMADLDGYCSGGPVYIRFDNYVYDFTGDGNDDIVTSYMYGSGIVRHVVVLYDVADQEFYSLGDENEGYSIVSFDDGHLTVKKYEGNDVVTGTVELIDNELVFSGDESI